MKYDFDCENNIRRFGRYKEEQLMQLKERLALQMTPSVLSLCASYYQSTEKRDPSVEELKTLDRLSSLSLGVESTLLTELFTNDGFCAETYADMMRKRREMLTDTDTPISVGEAMNLATAYLKRIGKNSTLDDREISLNYSCALTERAVGISGSPISLAVNATDDTSVIHEGDVFILMHRKNMPFWKYDSLLDPLFSSREFCESAKAVLTVPREGLLPMLTRRFDGVCYHLRALAPSIHSETIEQLIGKFSGYRVLVTAREKAERVASVARRMGFQPILFAAATKEPRTSFLYSENKTISYETSFLRAITSKQQMTAKLPTETVDTIGKISHDAIGLHSCRYLDAAPSSQRVLLQDGVSVASARGELDVSPYRTALQTALTAILSNAAAGGSVADEKIAFSLRTPSINTDENQLGQLLSAILGIYRLQCELAIPAAASEILIDDTLSAPELCVFSLSPMLTVPCGFSQFGNNLYCVSPITDENGLPNFDALRQMMRELEEFCKQALIKSARVLCNERITDTVQEMETDSLTFHLTDGAALAGAEIPFAILLESKEKLPYAPIGYVTTRGDLGSQRDAIQLPAFEKMLNRGDSYEILLLSAQTDVDAINLSRILGNAGANCVNLFDTTPNGVVARAIMGAQLVILCGEYTPDVSEQITFALRVLHEAGGRILRVGSDADIPTDVADFTLPNGLPSDLLSQISLQCEDLKSFS